MAMKMKPLEEAVVTAMDGSDRELFPFLPYLLQDLWEMGTDPKAIVALIRKHTKDHSNLSVLDLGCGKGAVSIKTAGELKCTCLGIDAIKEFIDEANRRAKEFGVGNLCTFEVGDIRRRITGLKGFDVIILGSIGPVLGNYHQTLTILSKSIGKNGKIIIDDGYIESDDYMHPLVEKRETIIRQIRNSGMKLIDEVIIDKNDIEKSDGWIFANLKKRCSELIDKQPEKKGLFERYMEKQEQENRALETKITCATMVIEKI